MLHSVKTFLGCVLPATSQDQVQFYYPSPGCLVVQIPYYCFLGRRRVRIVQRNGIPSRSSHRVEDILDTDLKFHVISYVSHSFGHWLKSALRVKLRGSKQKYPRNKWYNINLKYKCDDIRKLRRLVPSAIVATLQFFCFIVYDKCIEFGNLTRANLHHLTTTLRGAKYIAFDC